MNIYLSSSWKNREIVRFFATGLRKEGFDVYDFTDHSRRTTPEIPPEKFPEQFDPTRHVYSDYINRWEWRNAIDENKKAIEECDAVVLILPCGVDATADWAYAVGLGKKSIIYGSPRAGERSPVHLWADAFAVTYEEVLSFLKTLP